ncbi:MAG: hypothetical protein QOD75_1336 [Blastocatellia bacterium]|jgi:hypothetical protein|nr:hypothetical protein [Blastocatellia bacterium]
MTTRIAFAILVLFVVSFAIGPSSLSCAQTPQPAARKFDEFGDSLITDIKARLDFYAVQLQTEPAAKGFIVVYRSHRDLPGLSHRYAERMREYLANTRGLANRVIAVDGGEADCLRQELWIVPPGASPIPRSDAYQRNFVDTDSVREFDELSWRGDTLAGELGAAWFEAYANALRAEPKAHAYLIAYAGYYRVRWSDEKGKQHTEIESDPPGSAQKMLTRARNILVKTYALAPSRIRLVNGGYRQVGTLELWIVPRGEHAPIATPNAFPPTRGRTTH